LAGTEEKPILPRGDGVSVAACALLVRLSIRTVPPKTASAETPSDPLRKVRRASILCSISSPMESLWLVLQTESLGLSLPSGCNALLMCHFPGVNESGLIRALPELMHAELYGGNVKWRLQKSGN